MLIKPTKEKAWELYKTQHKTDHYMSAVLTFVKELTTLVEGRISPSKCLEVGRVLNSGKPSLQGAKEHLAVCEVINEEFYKVLDTLKLKYGVTDMFLDVVFSILLTYWLLGSILGYTN